jgi:hypothetical protein
VICHRPENQEEFFAEHQNLAEWAALRSALRGPSGHRRGRGHRRATPAHKRSSFDTVLCDTWTFNHRFKKLYGGLRAGWMRYDTGMIGI